MQELDDTTLLREYVERGSEAAFAALVERHVNRVYSVAWRHTGNPLQAAEITQTVFILLARKAPHLRRGVILYAWLYQTARLTSVAFIRSEIRRTRREQEAFVQNSDPQNPEPEVWPQVAPLLDAALAALNETDRRALVLRFFYGKSMRETGADLGAKEAATKKRIGRALEKLQHYFRQRGIPSTTAALENALAANAVLVAPATLAHTATALALAKGATASTSTLPLIKGVLKIMACSKVKTAVVAAILAATVATIVLVKTAAHEPAGQSETRAQNRKAPGVFTDGINRAERLPDKLFTYPAGDEPTHRYVLAVVRQFYQDLDPARVVKSDQELTEPDILSGNIVIYGSPGNHRLFQRVREQLPILFAEDGVVVGQKKFLGRDVGAIFTCPNPLSPEHQLLIYGTVSPAALDNMNSIFHGPTDYIVFNHATRNFKSVNAADRFLLIGGFDKTDAAHWRVDERLELLPPRTLQQATAGVRVAR